MTVIEINLDFKDSCLELIKLYFYNLQVFTKCVYMYCLLARIKITVILDVQLNNYEKINFVSA